MTRQAVGLGVVISCHVASLFSCQQKLPTLQKTGQDGLRELKIGARAVIFVAGTLLTRALIKITGVTIDSTEPEKGNSKVVKSGGSFKCFYLN